MKKYIWIIIFAGAALFAQAQTQMQNIDNSQFSHEKRVMLAPNGLGRTIDAHSHAPFGETFNMLGNGNFDGGFDNIGDPVNDQPPGDWGDIDDPLDPVPLSNELLALFALAAGYTIIKMRKSLIDKTIRF